MRRSPYGSAIRPGDWHAIGTDTKTDTTISATTNEAIWNICATSNDFLGVSNAMFHYVFPGEENTICGEGSSYDHVILETHVVDTCTARAINDNEGYERRCQEFEEIDILMDDTMIQCLNSLSCRDAF